jgi:hypothetical protein
MSYDFREHLPEVERDEPHDEPAEESNEPIGTPKAGYAPPSDGPFECGRCEHYSSINGTSGHCDHPEVIEDLGDPATVAKLGCCSMFRPEKEEE